MSPDAPGSVLGTTAVAPELRRNPYLFVTGCTRSGTTLLQRMLDGHPELAVANDTHLIPRSIFGQKADRATRLTPALFGEIAGFKRFHFLGIDQADAARHATENTTLAEFVTALLDDYAAERGKPHAGEKDPEYVRRLPLLHRLFPEAQVVHIIRDGRDVALSTLDWVTPQRFLGRLSLWGQEPIAVCALWWQRQVAAGIDGGRRLGHRYLEVRYERLIADPEPTLDGICRFLGIPSTSKDQWLQPTLGLRDWRTSLDRRDLELFEALAGDLLSALGYPLATGPDGWSPTVLRRAAECREIWHSDLGLEAVKQPAHGL